MEHVITYINVAVTGAVVGFVYRDLTARQTLINMMEKAVGEWKADLTKFRDINNQGVEQMKSLSDRLNALEFRTHQQMARK